MKILCLSGSATTEGRPQPIPFSLGESGRGRTLTRVEVSSAPGKIPEGPPPSGPEVPWASAPQFPQKYDERTHAWISDSDPTKVAEYQTAKAKYEAYTAYEARKKACEAYTYDVDYLVPARPQAGGSVFLLKAGTVRPAQRGVLVRISTRGCYTKGSCGSIELVWGEATKVAEGTWAEGDAGRVAGGPDALWHVPGAAFFRVVLQGGSNKGWGGRCVVVTKDGRVWMGKTTDLAALVTADERPDLSEVVRAMLAVTTTTPPSTSNYDPSAGEYRQTVVEWYQILRDAVTAADALEAEPPADSEGIEHYFLHEPSDWPALLKTFGLTLPGGQTMPQGVDRVQAGCLMPGAMSMVYLSCGPGGGKRYRLSDVTCVGVRVLGAIRERPYNREEILAIVEDAERWSVSWTESKDGQQIGAYRADASGVTETRPDGTTDLRKWG